MAYIEKITGLSVRHLTSPSRLMIGMIVIVLAPTLKLYEMLSIS